MEISTHIAVIGAGIAIGGLAGLANAIFHFSHYSSRRKSLGFGLLFLIVGDELIFAAFFKVG
jgi:hypothetical protein